MYVDSHCHLTFEGLYERIDDVRAAMAAADVDRALLLEPVEHALADAVDAAVADTDPLLAARDYVGGLEDLAALRAAVDAFFGAVLVMADEPALRNNRLAQLRRLRTLFLDVADLSCLSTPGA